MTKQKARYQRPVRGIWDWLWNSGGENDAGGRG
jgi:hypothetical protein